MRALFRRFRDWNQASLFNRTVVTVAAFLIMACASIATMSFAAVTVTKAVFKPAEAAPSASASAPASGGVVDAGKGAAPSHVASLAPGGVPIALPGLP